MGENLTLQIYDEFKTNETLKLMLTHSSSPFFNKKDDKTLLGILAKVDSETLGKVIFP